MIVVYLAGGLKGDWQQIVRDCLPDARVFDPRVGGDSNPKNYTAWDLAAIRSCDIVFAYLEHDNPNGLGLALEVGYARALGKLVIFVDEWGDNRTAMVEAAADISTTDFKHGMRLLHDHALMLDV